MVKEIGQYIKKSIEAARERRKFKENMAVVEDKCHKAQGEFLKLMELIDEAAPKAPDARAASKLSCMRSRIEVCLNRLAQIEEAIKDRDCMRMHAINEALASMKGLVVKDASELLSEYAPHPGFEKTAEE